MATRAEWFRYLVERSGSKKPANGAKRNASGGPRRDPVRAGKKAVFVLEDSAGRPSRKSTRKSSNRQKTDVQFRMKQRTAEVRGTSRAGRAT